MFSASNTDEHGVAWFSVHSDWVHWVVAMIAHDLGRRYRALPRLSLDKKIIQREHIATLRQSGEWVVVKATSPEIKAAWAEMYKDTADYARR